VPKAERLAFQLQVIMIDLSKGRPSSPSRSCTGTLSQEDVLLPLADPG